AFTLAGALNWPARWFVAGGALNAAQVAEQMVEILITGVSPR
ncbi:MAG: TetR/AcrR family transcriptional regulator, partial [Pseudomonadota bacterium]|nr:TetR/AcrR family transcriptional regulator [Pseudomonadota bacterium]